jgi:hypothetical protein
MTPSDRPGAAATRETAGNVLEDGASEAIQAEENVVNEHVVRAAAGITMALGGVAFVYAYFDRLYWPLQAAATLFFVEFLARLTLGISRSPVGLVAGWLMRRQRPDWVSAKPKRFAWSLGLVMSGFMAVITNYGIRGWLPRSICLICLALMWLESVLGLCLGCEAYGQLVRRGWIRPDDAFGICAHGACDVTSPARAGAGGR